LRSSSLLIALLAGIFLREKLTLHQVVGSVLMVLGLVFIFSRGFTQGYTFIPGDLYILGASVIWASSAILMKKYLHHLPPEVIVVTRNTIGGMVLLAWSFSEVTTINLVPLIPLYLAGLAIFGVLLSQLLWYWSLEHTKASNVGIGSITTPIFGTFFAVIFLGETLAAYQLLGGLLVILGLIYMEIHLSQLSIRNLKRRLMLRPHFHH